MATFKYLSLPPVVCRRVRVLFTLFVFITSSGVQHILCCVLFCLSSYCVPYVASFSGLSFRYSLTFIMPHKTQEEDKQNKTRVQHNTENSNGPTKHLGWNQVLATIISLLLCLPMALCTILPLNNSYGTTTYRNPPCVWNNPPFRCQSNTFTNKSLEYIQK